MNSLKLSESIHLPVLRSSLAAEVHPNAAWLEEQSDVLFMDALGVKDPAERKQFQHIRLSMFTPMVIPRGVQEERMLLASLHTLLMFVIDDVLESAAHGKTPDEIKSMVMQVAEGTYDEASLKSEVRQAPLWILFESTVSKMRLQMHPILFERYLRCLSEYMDATNEEVYYRKTNQVMDEDHYRRTRNKGLFMEPVFIFADFSMDIVLGHDILQSSLFLDFVNALLDHVGLVNDVFSFRKEYHHGASQNWLIVLLTHREDVTTIQQAVDCVYGMIQEEEAKILKLQKELLQLAASNEDEGLAAAAMAYPFIASGNLAWSYLTPRYTGSDAGPNPKPLTWKIEHSEWEPEHPKKQNVMAGYDEGFFSMK